MATKEELPATLQFGNYTGIQNDMLREYSKVIDYGALVIWSYIFNRYQSSYNRDDFWDEESGDYYAICTVEELADLIGVSAGTIRKFTDQLVKQDLLIKKKPTHGFNQANRLFPKLPEKFSKATQEETVKRTENQEKAATKPGMTDTSKFEVSKTHFLGSNHLTFNHFSKTCYTFYTHSPKNGRDSNIQKSADTNKQSHHGPNTREITRQIDSNPTALHTTEKHEDLVTVQRNLIGIGVPEVAVKLLSAHAHNDPVELGAYRKELLEAKAAVKRVAIAQGANPEAFVHESNPMIQANFIWGLQRAFSYIRKSVKKNKCQTKEHLHNYFRSCMKTFYEAASQAFLMGNDTLDMSC